MAKVELKSLTKAAIELNEVLGCEPAIKVAKTTEKALLVAIKEAAGFIDQEDDEFTPKTMKVLKDTGIWDEVVLADDSEPEPEPEPVTKKPAKKAKKTAESEPEPEPEPVSEKKDKKGKKGKKDKHGKKDKKGKKGGETAAPKKAKVKKVSRATCISNAIKDDIPEKGISVDDLSVIADEAYVAGDGQSNVGQTKHHMNVLLPAAVIWGIINIKDGILFPA